MYALHSLRSLVSGHWWPELLLGQTARGFDYKPGVPRSGSCGNCLGQSLLRRRSLFKNQNPRLLLQLRGATKTSLLLYLAYRVSPSSSSSSPFSNRKLIFVFLFFLSEFSWKVLQALGAVRKHGFLRQALQVTTAVNNADTDTASPRFRFFSFFHHFWRVIASTAVLYLTDASSRWRAIIAVLQMLEMLSLLDWGTHAELPMNGSSKSQAIREWYWSGFKAGELKDVWEQI